MATAAQIALVRSVAPAYADASTYPDDVIEVRIDGFAASITGVRHFGQRYDLALAYAAAHALETDLRQTGGTTSGSGSASVGSITSASAGPQSISFGGAATSKVAYSDLAADLSQTVYGRHWLTLWSTRPRAVPGVIRG